MPEALFDKVQALGLQLYRKKRLWHKCFPVNFVKFLRTPSSIEHLWWLFLYLIPSFAPNRETSELQPLLLSEVCTVRRYFKGVVWSKINIKIIEKMKSAN